MFGVESNDIIIAVLNVHCKLLSWSVRIWPFDLVLEVFESVIQIQYFFEKSFFIFFVVRNYFIDLAVVFRIDNVLAGERGIVLVNYRYIEDGKYIAFG